MGQPDDQHRGWRTPRQQPPERRLTHLFHRRQSHRWFQLGRIFDRAHPRLGEPFRTAAHWLVIGRRHLKARFFIDRQPEHLRTRVVPGHVQIELSFRNLAVVEIGGKNLFIRIIRNRLVVLKMSPLSAPAGGMAGWSLQLTPLTSA
jgi:hypothetical protein